MYPMLAFAVLFSALATTKKHEVLLHAPKLFRKNTKTTRNSKRPFAHTTHTRKQHVHVFENQKDIYWLFLAG